MTKKCWETRGCDEEMMLRCPHSVVGESCPAQCHFAACFRPTHEVCQDFAFLLNPQRNFNAAVKEVCRFCSFFLMHGPDFDPELPVQGSVHNVSPNRFLL